MSYWRARGLIEGAPLNTEKDYHMTTHIQKTVGNFFLMLAVSVLLAACASGPDFSKIPPLPTDIAPVAPVAEKLAPYKVQIGDTLDISFYLNPEFT
jgi:hypothetical protein